MIESIHGYDEWRLQGPPELSEEHQDILAAYDLARDDMHAAEEHLGDVAHELVLLIASANPTREAIDAAVQAVADAAKDLDAARESFDDAATHAESEGLDP